jgi:hypothetical protein
MGFVAITFRETNSGITLSNIYVSLFSFSLSKQSMDWKCRMILQAHRSREEKQAGYQGMYLPYSQQIFEFVYDISDNIYDKCYEYGKQLFGPPENIIDEIDGVIQWPPPPIVVIDLSANVVPLIQDDLSGNTP